MGLLVVLYCTTLRARFLPPIKIITFIYAINSIRKLVRLAQLVEQWTSNPEVGGSSPPSNHLIFGCLRNLFGFPLASQMHAKL